MQNRIRQKKLASGDKGRADIQGEGLILLELDQQHRVLVMDRHDFTLSVPGSQLLRRIKHEYPETHKRPLLKDATKSGRLFRSTHMSGVNM